ncbi:ATP-binding protein [Paraburkholderia hospita]|uniref:ATP-binding protein n=1 Tax=Paraburkholderia hospita TaxID=169430 RepID=UPI0009A6D6C4|nr:ATP-binding protein [Paraburkholderia hospita]SKD04409.1 Cyclic nucleotide-binding domain-containing protein [Paraburkholderia hospita]
MIELNELAKIRQFADLPPERLQWIHDKVVEFTAEAGEVLLEEGEISTDLLLLLQGEVSLMRLAEGEISREHYVAPWLFGTLGVIASIPYPATARAATDCRLARLREPAFRELFVSCDSFSRMITRRMSGWLAGFESAGRSREKLEALGKLSAGVAHELNNPASAVARALAYMLGGLDGLEDSALALGWSAVPREAVVELRALAARQALDARATGVDLMGESKAESELCDWLAEHRVAKPWLVATSLVAHGISADQLSALALNLNEAQFGAAISWIAQFIELRTVVVEAMRGAARISEIVNAMKSYSYMDQGPQQEVDIHAGLEDTLAIMAPELRDGVVVTRDYDRSLPRIQVYGSELNLVWTRIIENAVEAMNAHGKLTIRTRHNRDCAMVEIIDSGPGIPEEAMPHLFEPFFTAKPIDPMQGRGLGLHIAYRIVVYRHAGSIKATSHPGETTFRVMLPLLRRSGA